MSLAWTSYHTLSGSAHAHNCNTDAQRARRGLNDLEQLDTHCTRDLEAHHDEERITVRPSAVRKFNRMGTRRAL